MKILIVNNYYYPNMEGGAEFSVKLLAENLAERGHEVCVLSMDGKPESNVLQCEIINQVKVYRSYSQAIYRRRILKNKSHFSDKILNGLHSIVNPKMNKDVKILINRIQPKIIHTHNLVSMSYWIWKYAKLKKIPVVHTLRDYWLLDPTTNIKQSSVVVCLFFRTYNRYLSNKYVDLVTSPSNRTLEIFKENGYFVHCHSKRIVNAILYDEDLLKQCLKDKLIRKDEEIKFIFAGKVAENKGIKLLVKAFIKSRVNATLTICGTGNLEKWILEKKNSKIIMLGKLDQQALFNEYKNADVLIVPSLWEEPFGRILIEGAQFGLPAIGSNKGGIPEIIQELDYGTVFNINNENELIEVIRKYADREYIKKMLSTGPKGLELYSIENQISDFENLYNCLYKDVE